MGEYQQKHVESVRAIKDFSFYYKTEEKSDKAYSIFENTVSDQLFSRGDDQIHTAISYVTLAGIYISQNQLDLAETYNTQSNQLYEQFFEKNCVCFLQIHCNFGQIYYKKHEYIKAIDQFLKQKNISDRVHGENSYNIFTIYGNIALCYLQMNKSSDQALNIFQKANKIYDKIFSRNLKNINEKLANLVQIGIIYKNKQDDLNALETFQEVIKICIQNNIQNDKLLFRTYRNLATIYQKYYCVYDNYASTRKSLFHKINLVGKDNQEVKNLITRVNTKSQNLMRYKTHTKRERYILCFLDCDDLTNQLQDITIKDVINMLAMEKHTDIF